MIGALHALSLYPTIIRRVAIIDFDVHHGNGTQDIIKQRIAPYSREAVLFFSIHLFDREEDAEETLRIEQAERSGQPLTPVATRGRNRWEFYPGSGDCDLWDKNIFNVPIVPLWKELEASAAAFGSAASGTAGQQQQQQQQQGLGTGGAMSTGISKSTRGRSASQSNDGSHSSSGRMAYRKAIKERMIPLIRAYKPDLILISAGFDAGAGDVGCCKATMDGKAISGADLKPEDFEYITRQIVKLANVCCQGRVVSVLEGGYGSYVKSKGDDPKKMELNRDMFAKSVATHVLALSGMSNEM